MSRLERYNPIIVFIYFMITIFIAMFSMHPFIITMSFCGSLALNFKMMGVRKVCKSFVFILPMMIVLILTNPLFVHKGVTELFFINGNAITLEAILYGVAVSFKLAGVIYWFSVYSYIMTSDKIVYLFGKVSPKLGLVLSMSLRFVPMYLRKFREADDAVKALGGYSSKNLFSKIKTKLHTLSVVFSVGLEGSILTADSMTARGYGLKGRTHYHNYKWTLFDVSALCVLFLLGGVLTTFLVMGYGDYYFYPAVENIKTNWQSVVLYSSYFIMTFMAFAMEVKEVILWQILKSKI